MSAPKNEYQVAVVLTISAPSYAQALAKALEMEVCRKIPSRTNIQTITEYERDNEGQRVLYLSSVENERPTLPPPAI